MGGELRPSRHPLDLLSVATSHALTARFSPTASYPTGWRSTTPLNPALSAPPCRIRFFRFCGLTQMPAANYTRSWLPEMLDELEKHWKRSFTWEDYSPLCDRLTEIRTQVRRDRGVKNPRMFCRHCNGVHEMTLAPITIRSVLFAL